MKNSSAVAALLKSAETAADPLDYLACRRAAAWLRFMDGSGATLTEEETDWIAGGKNLADAARMIVARLAEEEPGPKPIEDVNLSYLDAGEDEGGGWEHRFAAIETPPQKQPDRPPRRAGLAGGEPGPGDPFAPR